MISRDYLLRQIQQFANVLARIVFLKSSGQATEAALELDHALRESPEWQNLGQAGLMRDEVIGLCLGADGSLQAGKAVVLADLLYEKAFLSNAREQVGPAAQYALWLYEATLNEPAAAIPLDIQDRIAALAAIRTDSQLTE